MAQNLQIRDECWVNVIRYIEHYWNKTNVQMRRRAKWQGWLERGQIDRRRKRDPLLAFLCNARGAEEHGVPDIYAT